MARASRLLGLGAPFIVGGPGDETFDAEVLDHRLRREASEGRRIAAIVATAGSARTGAFDDMVELAAVAKAHSVWLHVDGAFGAWARLLPDSARVRGLELAHSVALDYHKAIHAPYATGAVLVRRRGALQRALAEPSDYLSGFPGGFGGLKDWPGERSLATSRGFGALGVWATWAGAGHGALKAGVEQSYTLAQELEERLRRAGWLTAPVHGPIVAFGPPSREGLGWSSPRPAQKIVTELQHRGEAVITPVRLGGRWALRACTLGLGTTLVDIDALVNFLSELYSVGPQR
ncbi:MAG: pyridoxal-dependent decarboxylase [Myxococcota bacterium]